MDERTRNAARALSERVVKPWCRAWARYLGDRPADPIYELLCAYVFWEAHHYWPQFREPRTFSEKLWHRCLYDRDPLWTLLSDKLRSRDYIIEQVGTDYLVPLLWSGSDPDSIPFDSLPPRAIVKTNHGCGYNLILDEKTGIDRAAVRGRVAAWLKENYCESQVVGMEWGYKNVPPRILIEAFLGNGEAPPTDYKFYCYSGRAHFIQVNQGRFGAHQYSFFDRDFRRLPMRVSSRWSSEGTFAHPENLDEMIQVAERLAGDLAFIRVDLYSVGDRIYAGELTCYPGGGLLRFDPRSFDDSFGENWRVGPSRP